MRRVPHTAKGQPLTIPQVFDGKNLTKTVALTHLLAAHVARPQQMPTVSFH